MHTNDHSRLKLMIYAVHSKAVGNDPQDIITCYHAITSQHSVLVKVLSLWSP